MVWRLDRLGRTTKGLCQLFDELRERKVDLVSLKDGFSLESPARRLHARILASVAEYETEIRHERVIAGQAVARRKGKKWGGSKKVWRWKVSDDQLSTSHENAWGRQTHRSDRTSDGPFEADHLPGLERDGTRLRSAPDRHHPGGR